MALQEEAPSIPLQEEMWPRVVRRMVALVAVEEPIAVVAAVAVTQAAEAVKAPLAVPEVAGVVPLMPEPILRHRPAFEAVTGRSKFRGRHDVEILKILKY